MKYLQKRKSKKAISGAVTALILVIASVIIALVVVGFAFGLFGAYAGKATVQQIGTGVINGNQVSITLQASAPVSIIGIQLAGTNYTTATSIKLSAGTNIVSFLFSFSGLTFVVGQTYSFVLTLSNGATVTVVAQAVS